MVDAAFWAVHSGLAREGPGDDGSLRRALSMMKGLPAAPDILDIGCGPGAQSLALTSLTAGAITAVDAHAPFLAELNRAAESRGLADRITTLKASMDALPFADASFDAVWSEGAIYIMGFDQGLAAWKRLLRPGGYLAVSEPCWLAPRDQIPAGALALWSDYPAMRGVDAILQAVGDCGYRAVGHFVLPPAAWGNYYEPMQTRIDQLREAWRGEPAALERLAPHQSEIDGYRAFGTWYGYMFVVMQAP
jgi:SAM-dependent methyltransferase